MTDADTSFPYENWDEGDIVLNVQVSHWGDLQTFPEDDEDAREDWTATLHDSTDAPTAIGTAWIHLFRYARFDPRFYDRADEVDADLEQIAAAISNGGRPVDVLFRHEAEEAFHVVVIDRMSIDPAWRGRGYGAAFVQRALDLMLPTEAAVVAVFPAPVEVAFDDRTPADWERVRRFWVRHAKFVHHARGVAVKLHAPEASAASVEAWRERVRRPWAKPE